MEGIEFNTLYVTKTSDPKARHYRIFWKNAVDSLKLTEYTEADFDPKFYDVYSIDVPKSRIDFFTKELQTLYHKANLKEYMDWTKLYNDGSLKFDVRELDPLAKLPEDSLKIAKDYSGLFE